ncbi:MAG: DinB family protein [Acidobacteriota bacterium]
MSKPAHLDTLLRDWNRIHHQTVRLMELTPDDKYDWKPHETSMTLGALVNHMLQAEAGLVEAIINGVFPHDFTNYESTDKLIAAFNKSHDEATAKIRAIPDEAWEEKVAPFGPDRSFSRLDLLTLSLEHEIHHRGQLYVYLRMLGCPIPELFG